MNEIIKALAEQASHQSPDGYPVTIPYSKDFAKKFAELIVRECIEVIDSTSDNTKLMRVDPYQKIIWAIETHFGVEE